MNALKSFTTACLIYSLVSVSGLPIIESAHANGITDEINAAAQSEVKTYHYQKKQVDADGNEYTTSSFKGEGEDQMVMADYLAMLTMLAMGVVASSLAKAKPMTTDIMLGAGSGAAYIGAEVYTMIAYDNIDVDQQIDVKMNESGVVDHEQLQALEKQKQSYMNIENAAKTKAMIQAAATVGFMGAAGVAGYQSMKSKHTLADCMLAAQAATAEANAACAAASIADPTCFARATACTTQAAVVTAEIGKIMATESSIQPSCTQTTELTALYNGTIAAAQSASGACQAVPAASASGLSLCAAEIPRNISQLVCASHLQILKMGDVQNNYGHPAVPTELKELQKTELFQETLMGMYPYLGAELVAETRALAPLYFEADRNILPIHSRVHLNEMNLDSYISAREHSRFAGGELVSLSVDDYQNLRSSFGERTIRKNSIEFKALLSAALEDGLNLFIPKANAKVAAGVGVGIAAAGLLYGISGKGFQVIDRFMSTPGHRALVWAGIAALAAATAYLSKTIADKMSGNASRIDEIIAGMRRLNDTGKIDGIGGTNGTQQTITQTIVRPLTDIKVDPTGTTTLPCVGGGKPPCKSISGNLDKTAGFIELQSNPLGNLSTLTGQVADGIQGQSTLTAGTLNKAQNLANQKEAVAKRNKGIFDELNKLRLKNKEKPIDFDKESKRFADSMMNAARRKLRSDPNGASRLFASLAPTMPLNNVEEELAKEEATEDLGAEDGSAVATFQGNNKPEDAGFSFDFGEDNGNTILGSEEEVAALPDVIEGETGNDISNKPNIPIWTIISVRYMKSGFPRLLETKE